MTDDGGLPTINNPPWQLDLTVPIAAVYTSVQTLEFCRNSAIKCHESGRLAYLQCCDLAPHVVSDSVDRTCCVSVRAVGEPRGTGRRKSATIYLLLFTIASRRHAKECRHDCTPPALLAFLDFSRFERTQLTRPCVDLAVARPSSFLNHARDRTRRATSKMWVLNHPPLGGFRLTLWANPPRLSAPRSYQDGRLRGYRRDGSRKWPVFQDLSSPLTLSNASPSR